MNINIIVAHCKNNGIGINNTMPWQIKDDLKNFKRLTIGEGNNAIIMGKNTWDSLKNKSLANRDNLILSTTLIVDELIGKNITKSFKSIDDLEDFVKLKDYDELWIIGGEKIYETFLNINDPKKLMVNNIYFTYIDKEFKCDTYFPNIDDTGFSFISKELHRTNESMHDFNILDVLYKRI